MNINLRQAVESDRDVFVGFKVKLSNFNRSKHESECKYDDYEVILSAIKSESEIVFNNVNEDTLILIAELEGTPVGYALGRIFQQDETADNGTGLMGLFDELFVDEVARGYGLGQKLIDEVMGWMKSKGINRVKLHAYSWNNSAKKLYEKNGFKEYVVSYEKFI